MLETSLSKTSDSVSLELFTYNDLEQLRNKKMNNNSSISSLNNNNNNNKRYLILTYNVEFDRYREREGERKRNNYILIFKN
jgi:coiled-coil domain-containing protein 61